MPLRPTHPVRAKRRVVAAAGLTALIAALSAAGLGAGTASASSHREAPLIAADPQADNTDTYAFVSPDKPDTVTLLANWIPLEEPNGGPTYYPFANGAHYDIKVDNNGDGKPDITYQWVFSSSYQTKTTFLYNTGVVNNLTDPTLNYRQTYTLTEIDGAGKSTTLATNVPTAPSFTGKAGMPNYAMLRQQALTKTSDGGTTFAGQADDPFFLDLRVFDLLYGTDLSETGHDTLSGYNVNTIALQVPINNVALKGDGKKNPVIGVWSTTERQATTTLTPGAAAATGDFVQVSRLGNPLVNEVVIPVALKDAFNGLKPENDHTVQAAVDSVTKPEVPKLIEKLYGIKAPAEPRNDLVEIFLTGIAKNAPTLDGSKAPIAADLNSQVLNGDVDPKAFVPAEELRLNTAVAPTAKPNRLGVLAGDFGGFPNGRRLADDVVDITLQAAEGAAQSGKLVPALAKGDGVDANDHPFGTTFPYVALPNEGSVNQASAGAGTAGSTAATKPSGGVQAGAGGSAPSSIPLLPLGAAMLGVGLAGAGVFSLRRSSL